MVLYGPFGSKATYSTVQYMQNADADTVLYCTPVRAVYGNTHSLTVLQYYSTVLYVHCVSVIFYYSTVQ